MFSSITSLFSRNKASSKGSNRKTSSRTHNRRAFLSVEGLENRLVPSGSGGPVPPPGPPTNGVPVQLPDSPYFFAVTAPSTVTDGISFSVTVTEYARKSGNVYPSSDNFELVQTNGGTNVNLGSFKLSGGKAKVNVTPDGVGSETILAEDGSFSNPSTYISGGTNLTAKVGAFTKLGVSVPNTAVAGSTFTATVTAEDVNGFTVPTATATPVFTASGQQIYVTNGSWSQGAGTYTLELDSPGSVKITATSGKYTGSTSISINPHGSDWFTQHIVDPGLQAVARNSFNRDGALTYNDWLALFARAEAESSTVTATMMADFKTLLNNASYLKIPGFVVNLASKVVVGDPSNSTIDVLQSNGDPKAIPLGGNLKAGDPATKLGQLVSKRFDGTDEPLTAFGGNQTTPYQLASNTTPLFNEGVPKYTDVQEGQVGDCWLIVTLAEVAFRDPSVIENMFTPVQRDSHNNVTVWAVQFFINGTPDFVTVDDNLPGFADGTNGGLWVALAVKAYAEEAGSGKIGAKPFGNSYNSLNFGGATNSEPAITGNNANYYLSGSSIASNLLPGWQNGQLEVVGTPGLPSNATSAATLNGAFVVEAHDYAVVGYNSTTKYFTLYNPWGINTGTFAISSTIESGVCPETISGTAQQIAAIASELDTFAGSAASLGHVVAAQDQLATSTGLMPAASDGLAQTSHTDAVFSNLVSLPQGTQIQPLATAHMDALFGAMGIASQGSMMSDLDDPLVSHKHRDLVWAN
jgi:hypothetical protein